MAPKGTKRAGSSAAVAPAKKPKTIVGFAKKCDVVREALDHAEDITDGTRKMLKSSFPQSIELPKDQRHPHQVKVASWVQDALASIEANLKKAVDAAELEFASQTNTKESCQAAQDSAKEAIDAKCEAVAAKRIEVADAETKLTDAKTELLAAEQAQQDGNAHLVSIASDKSKIEEVSGNFMKLKEGGVAPEEEKGLLKSVSAMGTDMELDQSMLTSLPSALTKAPDVRGQFDNMVLTSFEGELKKRIETFIEKLADGEPAKLERAGKVEAAKTAVETCTTAAEACKEQLAAAIAEKDAAQTASKEAISATKTASQELKTAAANLNAAKKNLTQLEKGALADFKELDEWDGKPKGSQYKTIGGVRYEKDLLEMAGEEEITMEKAGALFEKAMDGNIVTPTEKRTLRYILKNKGFVGEAKNYLETKMGSSWYQTIDGVQYERTLLTIASNDAAPLGKESAEKLMSSACDGNAVTACEKRTLQHILDKIEFTSDAKTWLEEQVAKLEEEAE